MRKKFALLIAILAILICASVLINYEVFFFYLPSLKQLDRMADIKPPIQSSRSAAIYSVKNTAVYRNLAEVSAHADFVKWYIYTYKVGSSWKISIHSYQMIPTYSCQFTVNEYGQISSPQGYYCSYNK